MGTTTSSHASNAKKYSTRKQRGQVNTLELSRSCGSPISFRSSPDICEEFSASSPSEAICSPSGVNAELRFPTLNEDKKESRSCSPNAINTEVSFPSLGEDKKVSRCSSEDTNASNRIPRCSQQPARKPLTRQTTLTFKIRRDRKVLPVEDDFGANTSSKTLNLEHMYPHRPLYGDNVQQPASATGATLQHPKAPAVKRDAFSARCSPENRIAFAPPAPQRAQSLFKTSTAPASLLAGLDPDDVLEDYSNSGDAESFIMERSCLDRCHSEGCRGTRASRRVLRPMLR